MDSIKFLSVTMTVAFFVGLVALIPATTLAGEAATMTEEGAKKAGEAVKEAGEASLAGEEAKGAAGETGIHAGSAPAGESEQMSREEKAADIKEGLKEAADEVQDKLK